MNVRRFQALVSEEEEEEEAVRSDPRYGRHGWTVTGKPCFRLRIRAAQRALLRRSAGSFCHQQPLPVGEARPPRACPGGAVSSIRSLGRAS